MSGTGTAPTTDPSSTCSNSTTADGTTEQCPAHTKSVTRLRWDNEETWCSEPAVLTGDTRNYSDGEQLAIDVKDKSDSSAIKNFNVSVSGDSFSYNWDVLDVLPSGGPSWVPRRRAIASGGGKETPRSLSIRFIPNVTRAKADQSVTYQKQDASGTMGNVSVESRYEIEVTNYLLTIYGSVKYVRGWGKYVLKLADATATGGFAFYGGETYHWGRQNTGTGGYEYWDGSAWQPTPAAWVGSNTNHFGIAFYKTGGNWVCQDDTSKTWPEALTDWPANIYTGAGNTTTTTLNTWKTNIDNMWTDKFDIKRKECRSTDAKCCRYKTRCVSQFDEISAYEEHCVIVVYENTRSHASMWSMADNRPGLAPHEFGHHLGNPDEYGGQTTTQDGVNDADGLVSGVDASSVMGSGMTTVKKRHMRGICENLAHLVSDQYSKTYTYEPVDKGDSLASPAGTATASDPGSGNGLTGTAIGAIVGAVVGAIAGAIIGFVASGGNPMGAVMGGLFGAAAGAIVGAGIGSLF